MTFSKLTGFGFLSWLLLAVLKVLFFKMLGIDASVMAIMYLALTLVVAMACVRRLGVINYLEAIMVSFLWLVMVVILDSIITASILGVPYFSRWQSWVGYAVMVLGVFFLHKKRHVHIRKELHAHHHGHH